MVIILLLGTWGLIRKDNLIKKVIALNIVNSTIIIFFIYLGSLSGNTAPIVLKNVAEMVDPLPQALMLTAIVIGISVTALALTLIAKIYRYFGTLDIRRIEKALKKESE